MRTLVPEARAGCPKRLLASATVEAMPSRMGRITARSNMPGHGITPGSRTRGPPIHRIPARPKFRRVTQRVTATSPPTYNVNAIGQTG